MVYKTIIGRLMYRNKEKILIVLLFSQPFIHLVLCNHWYYGRTNAKKSSIQLVSKRWLFEKPGLSLFETFVKCLLPTYVFGVNDCFTVEIWENLWENCESFFDSVKYRLFFLCYINFPADLQIANLILYVHHLFVQLADLSN